MWPALVLLGISLAVFEATPLDLALQDQFYDFATHRWWVDAKAPIPRWIFYDGPKVLLILLASWLIAVTVGPDRWRHIGKVSLERRDLYVALAILFTVPLLSGFGKRTTNVFCPSEIRRYGGEMPYVKLFEQYPDDDRPSRRGHCFPAGHASGGFALVGLAWLLPSRRFRVRMISLGLGVGWTLGLYQMLKGAHYLSHTVTTMLVAWIVMLLWRRVWPIPRRHSTTASDQPGS